MATGHRKSKSSRPPKQPGRGSQRPAPPRPAGRPAPPPRPVQRKVGLASAPEVEAAPAPVGRDTLAAIAEELAGIAQASSTPAPRREAPSRPRFSTLGYEERPVERLQVLAPSPRRGSAPDLAFGSAPAGRETLAAIAEELAGGEAPAVVRRDFDDGPEITTHVRPAGRETLAAIESELASALEPSPRAPQSSPRLREGEDEIFEMVTFVVRTSDTARLSTASARREFVAERLMHRLPVTSQDDIDRVDVTPWTVKGTVIVRVWCKV